VCDVLPSDIAVASLPPSAECATHACRTVGDDNPSGFCTALCRDDADCPSGFACSVVEETIDGRGTLARDDDLTASWRECERRDGSGTSCVTTADCPASEACFATADASGAPIRICVRGAFPSEIGQPCLVGCFAPFGCVKDWYTNERYCTELCADDADCGESGLVCRRLLDERTNVDRTICVRPDDPRGEPL
jgi:hypothetical protein